MGKDEIAIFGAGGFGREVAHWIEECEKAYNNMRAVCFVDENPAKQGIAQNDLPVMGLAAARKCFPQARIVGATGSPRLRQHLMQRAAEAGFESATVLHPRIECSPWVEIGEGTVVCAGTTLTTNIVLGKHVQINMHCTVAHDVVMADYATLAPGVHISGNVHLGKRVYVGSGAVLIQGTEDNPLVIGDDVVVGAGACVTKSVAAGLTVVGVPARPLERKAAQT